jgi:nucleoid-associated protein YgaU
MSVTAQGMAASLVSAYIEPIEPPGAPITFAYNPKAYSIQTKGNWKGSSQPATDGPAPQWLGVEPPTLDVEMLLDAFSVPPCEPSVVIEQLKLLTLPTALSMATESSSAPIVMFGWGSNIIMDQAVVEWVNVEYQRFLLGVPVRARATVHLRAVPLPSPLGPTNPSSGGLATQRTRTVVEGDSLASIAYQEYKDPNKWRALAESNNIDDPMRVKNGTVLIVPDRREADALS